MKILFLLLAIVASNLAFAEFGSCILYAVTTDADGYTNLRADATSKSKVIHEIYENVVFEIVDASIDGWVKARVSSDLYGMVTDDLWSGAIEGYVHKSRIVVLEELPVYDGKEIRFEFLSEPFDSTSRVIGRHVDGWVEEIDGRKILGVDGDLPRNQVKSVSLTISGKNIAVHEVLYQDLFNCNNQFEFRKFKDTYFICQFCSDGAGSYEVLWTINATKGITQRWIHPGPC